MIWRCWYFFRFPKNKIYVTECTGCGTTRKKHKGEKWEFCRHEHHHSHLNGHYFCLGFDHILIHLAILPRQAALKQTSETKPQKPLLKTDGQRELKAGWDCQGDTKLSDRAVGFVSLRKKNTISIFFFIDLQIKVDCVKVRRRLAQKNPSLDLFWFIPARGKILFSWRIIHISLVLECAGQTLQEEEGVKWVCDLKDALQLLLLTAPLPSPSEKLEQKYYLFRL